MLGLPLLKDECHVKTNLYSSVLENFLALNCHKFTFGKDSKVFLAMLFLAKIDI